MAQLGYQQVFSLVLEQLKTELEGQHAELVEAVVARISKGAASAIGEGPIRLPNEFAQQEAELVRQAYWDCVIKGLVVPGMDDANPSDGGAARSRAAAAARGRDQRGGLGPIRV
ncbi:MAG: hypothetical protein ABIY55_08895 [Kofleriaceae bacterium]